MAGCRIESCNRSSSRLQRRQSVGARSYCFILAAASFLHLERNFLRSLPCTSLASASLEHSMDSAVRGLASFFSAGAIVSDFILASVLVSVLAAGAVCAIAVPASRREARAAIATREAMVMVKTPLRLERVPTSSCEAEPMMNRCRRLCSPSQVYLAPGGDHDFFACRRWGRLTTSIRFSQGD